MFVCEYNAEMEKVPVLDVMIGDYMQLMRLPRVHTGTHVRQSPCVSRGHSFSFSVLRTRDRLSFTGQRNKAVKAALQGYDDNRRYFGSSASWEHRGLKVNMIAWHFSSNTKKLYLVPFARNSLCDDRSGFDFCLEGRHFLRTYLQWWLEKNDQLLVSADPCVFKKDFFFLFFQQFHQESRWCREIQNSLEEGRSPWSVKWTACQRPSSPGDTMGTSYVAMATYTYDTPGLYLCTFTFLLLCFFFKLCTFSKWLTQPPLETVSLAAASCVRHLHSCANLWWWKSTVAVLRSGHLQKTEVRDKLLFIFSQHSSASKAVKTFLLSWVCVSKKGNLRREVLRTLLLRGIPLPSLNSRANKYFSFVYKWNTRARWCQVQVSHANKGKCKRSILAYTGGGKVAGHLQVLLPQLPRAVFRPLLHQGQKNTSLCSLSMLQYLSLC